MANSYDLDKDQTFQFTLGGNVYVMRYPNSEEMDALGKLGVQNEQIKTQLEKKPGDAALLQQAKAGSDELTAQIYDLITPKDGGAPSIADAMKPAGLNAIRQFGRMITKELSLEID